MNAGGPRSSRSTGSTTWCLRHEPFRLHSADVVFTGVLFAATLLTHLPLAISAAGLELLLYVGRKVRFRREDREIRAGWSAVRLTALAGGMLALRLEASLLCAMVAFGIGELVDRGELYNELRAPTPAGHMARTLAERLRAVGQVG